MTPRNGCGWASCWPTGRGPRRPLAALIGHDWRIHAAYLSARLDVVNGAVTAIERLARRSALPLARWHLHRLHASRTMLTGQFAESAEHSRRAFGIARDFAG